MITERLDALKLFEDLDCYVDGVADVGFYANNFRGIMYFNDDMGELDTAFISVGIFYENEI